MITPNNPTPGLAQFQSDTIGGLVELFFGDTPAPVTEAGSYTAALGTAGIPANTPVVFDTETRAISLVADAATKANAITVGDLLPGSPAGSMAVYRAGNFNINALNWPAALNTESLRFAAFDLSKGQIYVNKPFYS